MQNVTDTLKTYLTLHESFFEVIGQNILKKKTRKIQTVSSNK
jgi:hypothetical protein